MLRRTAFLALMSLALGGCVTYEVVERRVYHADGSVTRLYDPIDDGRRYEDRTGGRRYAYDAPRYGGTIDDPYDRWFYGYRGYGSAWALDPYFAYGGPSVRIVYGSRWSRPTGYLSSWYAPAWSSPWGWSPWWHGSGYGHGYVPSRPYYPRPPTTRPVEPRPMPKPVVRAVGPEVSLPVMAGPSVGGEALRPVVRERRVEEPRFEPREPERVFERRVEEPRFEPREPERVFERRVEEPRFEPREPERVFERRVEEPRFEPREPERVFERRVEEPRFEPRAEPRFEPREDPVVEDHIE